jgi:hypothetical protein
MWCYIIDDTFVLKAIRFDRLCAKFTVYTQTRMGNYDTINSGFGGACEEDDLLTSVSLVRCELEGYLYE